MFENKTVFLLGAGASWHYGYPTGEELVKRVEAFANQMGKFCKAQTRAARIPVPQFIARYRGSNTGNAPQIIEDWGKAERECLDLEDKLARLNPLVIDYFLGYNLAIQEIGKLAIAAVLLQSEADYLREKANPNRRVALMRSPLEAERAQARGLRLDLYKDDWYRFVLHKLVLDADTASHVIQKPVRFVTFNYDVSLEYALRQGLTSVQWFSPEHAAEFLADDRIVHVYGRIRRFESDELLALDWDSLAKSASNPDDVAAYFAACTAVDHAYEASKLINTIEPLTKNAASEQISKAVEAIAEARVVYILGYGFDKNNNERLKLINSLRSGNTPKCVMFTNFRDSERINRAASRLFFGAPNKFSRGQPFVDESPNHKYYYEKSIRDVYEALELDFDAMEDHFAPPRFVAEIRAIRPGIEIASHSRHRSRGLHR